jgi:aarF domain-containing kinase
VNIFRQLRKIFGIKGILENILNNLANEKKSLEEQQSLWLDLKTRIFACGSLYVKFLQWYISKLKSNVLDKNDTIYTTNLAAFVSYYEDIFENCPFHTLEETRMIFAGEGGMMGITLERYIHMDTLREVASGSIGQVYYARRKKDNREVAIKVKHPDIYRNLAEQVGIIRMLSYIQSFGWIRRRYNLIFSIDDFLVDINQQCDFNNEANNNAKFRANFQSSADFVIFPEVIFQSQDVLVSEYIPGLEFTSLTPMQQHMTVINFICFLYQMLFVDNFIHGDLHCKNWKVQVLDDSGNGNGRVRIVVYDTGICFHNRDTALSRDFWLALGKYDIKGLCLTLREFVINGQQENGNLNSNITDDDLIIEIEKMFSTILAYSVGTGMFLKSIINYCSSRNIMIDKFLLNLSITVCLLEEFFRRTDVFNKEKNYHGNAVAMYDIINENVLDIIAFCQVRGCYPGVLELFQNDLDNKYLAYQVNLQENNINEVGKNNTIPVLFNCLALSGLKMREPGSLEDVEDRVEDLVEN